MIDKQRTAFEALPVHAPHSNRNREKSMTTKTDTEQEREALLPCPFCNSTDISLHSGLHIAHVECGGCGAQGPTVIIQAGQPARSAWNRRAALASPEVQVLRDALWVATEHNALHFGESHNTVIQGSAALAAMGKQP